jgi:predicted  nucleic acid-binding Zn-ribbon protein
MKSFQQNLLIALALGLCGLCVYQWYGQTVQRREIELLGGLVHDKSAAIQSYTNSIQTMDRQIAQMDARITELKQAAKTNEQTMIEQRGEISKLQAGNRGLTNQIVEYKNAVGALEGKLRETYDGIKEQNDSVHELVTQRDELVQKLNDSIKARNEVVAKYNELAAQVEKSQGGK